MKFKMIAAAAALATAGLGLSAPVSAQWHDNGRPGVRHDNDRHDGRHDDKRRWHKQKHCRTVWVHHRKVRRCN